MSTIKGISAAAIALAVASASFVGATASADAMTAHHKPSICIVLPLCQSMPTPIAPPPHHRHHHHVKKHLKKQH